MITSIKLDDKIFEGYSVIEDENLNFLNKINVFIGKNNSGKSRFLRLLLKNSLNIEIKAFNSKKLGEVVEALKKEVTTYLRPFVRSSTVKQLYSKYIDLPNNSFLNKEIKLSSLKDLLNHLVNLSTPVLSDGNGINPQGIYLNASKITSSYLDSISQIIESFDQDSIMFAKVYIPILRGLRPLQISTNNEKQEFILTENNFLSRSKKDYLIETGKGIELHTGLDLFQKVTELLLGDHDERLKIKSFEDYLSETFFNSSPVHIVPRIGKDVLYIKIGDEKQFPIFDLGEGIQSIILLTYPLFFNEGEKMLFFIEEPELHLHPGLERVLIETFRDPRFGSFQYFITTHSNHILDLTLEYDDISVYSFQKKIVENKSSFLIKNISSNHKQVLDLLGVRNSSVFLANCTIWVEGITDRLYLRKYIEVLQKLEKTNFKEDYHFAFIEYAGNNITHWSFLETDEEEFSNINIEGICSKIFLIADNDGVELPDKKKSKKQERQNQLKEKLGDNFYTTRGREIENLLSKSVIKQVIKEMESYNAVLDFSNFDNEKKDHTKIYLGDFIEKNVTGIKRKYCSEYGTIYDKVNFCKKAVSKINSVDDLSNEAKSLANLLLSFIKNSNT